MDDPMAGRDSRELRSRAGAIEDAADGLNEILAEPGLVLLGKTALKGSTYPTLAGSVVYVAVQSIGGNELEGVVPTTAAQGDFLWAICPGSIPSVGTVVPCKSSGGYWII